VVVGVSAFVEGHDDVRAQVFLNADGFLGREAMLRPVDVTLEGHAVIVHYPGFGKRENLEAARISQHGMRPAHEAVQPAQLGYQVVAGTQVEVVGVGEHQRGAQVSHLHRGERLDRRLRTDRREDRCLQYAVQRCEGASAGAVILGRYSEIEHQVDYKGELNS
jgi:hypothetical protein